VEEFAVPKTFQRYGVFYTPAGAFAKAGAQWLGWDLATAQPVDEPDLSIVKRPQKYGFHGTIKPPFFLVNGKTLADLEAAFATLCSDLKSVSLADLSPACLGSFVALVPTGEMDALATLAGRVVSELDPFRAPASDAELLRRRKSKLTPAQDAHLMKWGYPYVFDQFKFHMTLSGNLTRERQNAVQDQAKSVFASVIPSPFVIDALSLVGERLDGNFELITRQSLGKTSVPA
jgi:hypothetical protein